MNEFIFYAFGLHYLCNEINKNLYMPDYDLIAILGPTASGKTPFAAEIGRAHV